MASQVYKGRRKCTGQITAMKFIMKHGKSEKDIKNLRQEIEILRELRHEHIIQMLDAFETKTDFCVVTGARLGGATGWHGARVCTAMTAACKQAKSQGSKGCSLLTCARGRCCCAEFAQGELFEILEDDQSLPEEVVQVGQLVDLGPKNDLQAAWCRLPSLLSLGMCLAWHHPKLLALNFGSLEIGTAAM